MISQTRLIHAKRVQILLPKPCRTSANTDTEIVPNEIPNDCNMATEAVLNKIPNDCNMATEAVPKQFRMRYRWTAIWLPNWSQTRLNMTTERTE